MTQQEELAKLIEDWHEKAEQVQDAHYEAGLQYERLFFAFGIPVIALSAITGSAEIMDLSGIGRRVTGIMSLCIAVIAGLQTFLKFSQRSERHRVAGARYGAIRRELEEVRVTLAEPHK